jgi:sarcosine oxidase
MRRVDVVVVGGGAMGSAAAWCLARRGRDTVLIEQFAAGHTRGSSHGSTRIFRIAYPEPEYVELARRARPLWDELEADCGTTLLETTGGIDHGDARELARLAAAVSAGGAAHSMLTGREAAERFPMFRFDGDVLFQPDAGRLFADTAVAALHRRARDHGAELRFEEPVIAVMPSRRGVAVATGADVYDARVVVVAAGAWTAGLLGRHVALPALEVTEEQVFHFAPRDDEARWPTFVHRIRPACYGLPAPEGVKVAEHHTGPAVDPATRTFALNEDTRARIDRYVETWLPGLEPGPVAATTCLYTTTPSEDFVIDRVGAVVVAAGFSGHGFKFTPLVGKLLADLAEGDAVIPGRFAVARSAGQTTYHL